MNGILSRAVWSQGIFGKELFVNIPNVLDGVLYFPCFILAQSVYFVAIHERSII